MLIGPDPGIVTADVRPIISSIAIIHATSNLVCVIFLQLSMRIAHSNSFLFFALGEPIS